MKKKIETMVIGNREFDVKNHTYVMGILNVTPDSFSDGGKYDQLDRALFHAQEMIDDGADIIDVGGESTRPGYTMISDEEEIERTVPVVEALKERFDIPISIDTYKSKVAKANIKAGVDLVNDIWGMKYDKDMAKLVADTKVACCLMHNRDEASYKHFMKEMIEDIKESVKIAKEAGADFVKTSTGFSTGGATVEDVALMRKTVGPDMGVKASGGVRGPEDAKAMIAAGANRLGTSAGVAIAKGETSKSTY